MSLGDFIKNELPKWPNWINMVLLRLNVFGSLVYGPSYRNYKKHLNDADPEQLLLESVNHAIKHVPYYRNLYGNLTLLSRADFEKRIGFIDKEIVMTHWNEFVVDDIDWSKVCTGTTGGTSGKPLKLVMPNNRYSWELAYMHSQWEKTGWHYHTRGVLRNHNLNGRDYAINPVLKEVLFDPNIMSLDYAKRVYDILRYYRIEYLHAYPSNAYQFCSFCVKQNLNLGFIKAIICGSEGVTEEQKHFFNKHDLKVLSFYGHSEKLILGSNDTTNYDVRIESNYGLCELMGDDGKPVDKPGEMGEMIGTTFYNRCFPLIRYRTGDFAVLKDASRYLVLSTIYGRRNKSLIYKNDGTITSTTVLNLHGDFYEHIDGIQYIQERKGYLTVLLIKNDLFTQKDEFFILNHIGNAMGGNEYVRIEYVDKLIFQPNGKFLSLISLVI